jgi:hypothetical protein
MRVGDVGWCHGSHLLRRSAAVLCLVGSELGRGDRWDRKWKGVREEEAGPGRVSYVPLSGGALVLSDVELLFALSKHFGWMKSFVAGISCAVENKQITQ